MLTLDVGNSSVGLGAWDGDEVVVTRAADLDAAAARIAEHGTACVGVTVSVARWRALEAAVAARSGPALRRLEGVPLPVARPRLAETAGADRLAAAAGALPGPAVVVDAGTAVTVDAVDAEGTFLGGFIAPGPTVALAGLHAGAPALPLLVAGAVDIEPGTETVAAMTAGAWGLAVGGVDRLVDAARAAAGEGARLLVTGGWGEAWLAASRHRDRGRLDGAVVHRGLRVWASR